MLPAATRRVGRDSCLQGTSKASLAYVWRQAVASESSKRTKWWANLLLCLSTISIVLLLAEIVLRLGFEEKISQFPRYVAEARYEEFTLRRLRPNTVFWHNSIDGSWKFTTNAQGFRDERDWTYQKPEGEFRVIALGDSHTQGYEVSQHETYARVAERYLNRRNIEARVLNTGISGFSTAEAMLFLENEGMKYNPDVIVLGFFGNDFFDNVKTGLFELADGELVLKKRTHIPGVAILNVHNEIFLLRWLSENSYLYSILMNTIWNYAKNALRARTEDSLEDLAVAQETPTGYMNTLTVKLLQRLHEDCRERGVPLIVVDIPQIGKGGEGFFEPSVPPILRDEFRKNSDLFLSAEEVFGLYRGVAPTHLEHGHRHINAFSHLILGVAVGDAIARSYLSATPVSGQRTHSAVSAE